MNNYHLIFVHFPIALLVVYSFFEVLNLFIKRDWFEMKALIVVLGTIGAIVSRITGDMVSEGHGGSYVKKTLELHEGVSGLATGIFVAISIIYILNILVKNEKFKNLILKYSFGQKLLNLVNKFLETFSIAWFLPLLATIGFIAIGLTGTLGGILAHGCQSDPMTNLVCNLFFLN